MLELFLAKYNYWIVIVLMMTGLYAVIATGNLIKRLVGLSLFQTSVFLLYITMSKVFGGQPPILPEYGGGHGDGYGDGHGGDAGHGAAAAGPASSMSCTRSPACAISGSISAASGRFVQ